MSSTEGEAGGSRPTNCANSVTSAEGGNSADSEGRPRELPVPAEKVSEFREAYPTRSFLPLTDVDGRRIREELIEERTQEHKIDPEGEFENGFTVEPVVERKPLTWEAAVEELLETHEDTRRTTLNFTHEWEGEWSKPAENRWMKGYQKRYYAQMEGWLRELTGGERPSGGATEAMFDDPHVALITRSASATPDGERLAPTDHDAALTESWQPVYHQLRNDMKALGYEIGEGWQYDRRQEPHTGERGGGANHCYTHEHVVVVVDGEVEPEDFKRVVDKHVESCEYAGEEAHTLDKAVEIKSAEEMTNIASYVASYCSIEPDDLLDRSPEYIGWAAIKHATNTKTFSRSDSAKHASKADSCKQRAESPKSDQEREHGETVVRSLRRGYEYECIECGSPHGIEQDYDTLTEARLASGEGGEVAADGEGVDLGRELEERWPSADAAAAVGEAPKRLKKREEIREYLRSHPNAPVPEILGSLGLPPDDREIIVEERADVDRTEPVGFTRPPRWELKSVTVGDEEHSARSGNGPTLVEVDRPIERLLDETKLGDEGTEKTYWRVHMHGDSPAFWGGRSVATILAGVGLDDPEVVEEIVEADMGELAS